MADNGKNKRAMIKFKFYHYILLIILLLACIFFIQMILSKQFKTSFLVIYQPDTTKLQTKTVRRWPPAQLDTTHIVQRPELSEPSKFQNSPDGRYTAYIEPLEWEVSGNIYLKEIKSGEIRQLSKYPANSDETPKKLTWLNDTLLLVIAGYTYGANAVVGGDLHLYNIRSGNHLILYKAPTHKDVAEVSVQGKYIALRIANWDKEYNNYTLSSRLFRIDSAIKAIAP
jgi:hypothetical protein